MHRRSEITSQQKVIVAFHDTCWITSEPAPGSVSSLPWKPNPYYSKCTLTLKEQLPSSAEATRSFQRPDQFTQQLTGHSVNLLPITPYFTLYPPLYSLFPLFLQWISFVMSHKNYLLSAEDKVSQCSIGAALGRVVTEEKKLCRDPERCPEMQLNRRRTHARIHHHYHHQREQQRQ